MTVEIIDPVTLAEELKNRLGQGELYLLFNKNISNLHREQLIFAASGGDALKTTKQFPDMELLPVEATYLAIRAALDRHQQGGSSAPVTLNIEEIKQLHAGSRAMLDMKKVNGQLQNIGVKADLSDMLLSAMERGAGLFTIQHLQRKNDKKVFEFFHIGRQSDQPGNPQSSYNLLGFSLIMPGPADLYQFPELIINGVNVADLDRQMKDFKWKDTISYTSYMLTEIGFPKESAPDPLRTILRSLRILEKNDKGIDYAQDLKLKHWTGTPFAGSESYNSALILSGNTYLFATNPGIEIHLDDALKIIFGENVPLYANVADKKIPLEYNLKAVQKDRAFSFSIKNLQEITQMTRQTHHQGHDGQDQNQANRDDERNSQNKGFKL